ncbi:MAG: protein kinase [Deltaproteobacteria bacterium]|nr:protein kinase [Deltaproteobacteria bacterium]
MTDDLATGQRIGERYVLDRLLGEGGMGAVWSAHHEVTGKGVALKFLKGSGTEERRRFVQEARVAAAIRHPNVTEVHDVLELDGGRPVMVMDLLEGTPLSDVLVHRGAIPVDELMPIALQVLAGLGAAHAVGVVHRDMKPDNIFLARSASGELTVKVLDFGIAKLTALAGAIRHTNAMTQTGSVLGTPHYMAPEQVYGEKELDHRADFWSLGVVLYECLTGKCPIEGANIGQLFKAICQHNFPPLAERMPSLDRGLATLVDTMMAAQPEARPESARDIAAVIARRTGLPLPAIAEPRWSPEARRLSQSPLAAFATTERHRAPLASRSRAVLALATASLAAVGLLVWRVNAEGDAGAVPRGVAGAPTGEPSSAADSLGARSADPVPVLAASSAPSTTEGDPVAPVATPRPREAIRPSPPSPPTTARPTTSAPSVAPEPPKSPARTGGIYEVSPY